jgi:8-oxo-dGTP pyrophosphatase MutT (NUDIX family)
MYIGDAKDVSVPVPRPAASLLLLSANNSILLTQRPSTLSFPNAHVFPGGAVSTSDPNTRITALRETFEETGILLTTCPPTQSRKAFEHARKAIHSGTLDFGTWVASLGVSLAVDALIPFSTWVTPVDAVGTGRKRFVTEMFLVRVPGWMERWIANGEMGAGDSVEVVDMDWWPLKLVLEKAAADEIVLFLPQFWLVDLLARTCGVDSHAKAKAGQDLDLNMLVQLVGPWICEPRRVGVLADGRNVMGLGPRAVGSGFVAMETKGGRMRRMERVLWTESKL